MHSWLEDGISFHQIFNNRAGKFIRRVFLAAVSAVRNSNAWLIFCGYVLPPTTSTFWENTGTGVLRMV